jgi:hypothetical protein
MTVEIACKEAVFHFNKHHLVDPTTPMWTIKTGGKTLYVEHVTSNMAWSTKETPDNTATKGSLKFKNALLTIDDENCAVFSELTSADLARLRAMKRNYARILITSQFTEIASWLKDNFIKHSTIKNIHGTCGSRFAMCDIKRQEDLVMMALVFHGNYRVLQPNETYFRAYDDPELLRQLENDEWDDRNDDEDDDI